MRRRFLPIGILAFAIASFAAGFDAAAAAQPNINRLPQATPAPISLPMPQMIVTGAKSTSVPMPQMIVVGPKPTSVPMPQMIVVGAKPTSVPMPQMIVVGPKPTSLPMPQMIVNGKH
jgi:hypothetical protein